MPTFMVIIGLFAMFAEAEMLSPFTDLFGIANPIGQRLAAFAIGCACANILHLTIESLSPGRFEAYKQTLLRVLGVFCIVGLVWAGIARGQQAAFGATLSGSPLADFIGKNTVLAMIVYTFFTVALPVAGAVAINFGTKAAREWREYLLAKRDVAQLTAIAAKAPKELESEEQRLRHELNTLEAAKQEWQKSYIVQHQRGAAIGAAQTPKWMIWVKAGFVALVALLLSLPAIKMPFIPIVIALTAYVGAWIYFHKAWAPPKPHQLYAQQNVEFRIPNRLGDGR